MKGQRVAHITQVACFQSALKIPRFICPKMFFDRSLVEVIVLSRSVVLLCKAMYQSAFLSLEFSLNWFAFHETLTLLTNRGNKIF